PTLLHSSNGQSRMTFFITNRVKKAEKSLTIFIKNFALKTQKDSFFCHLPSGIIYKITSDANDEQEWI
ncbi:hypothetical protein, partial [Bacteroides xylanisolvens]|uniref:hypothetical protein n=1 Tax=Bacteroides xylanisolvens TaxID=371601 RepID=UPI0019618D9C